MTRKEVATIATGLRSKYDLPYGASKALRVLLREERITVQPPPSGTTLDQVIVHPDHAIIFFAPSLDHPHYDNTTLAHLLGHVVLHVNREELGLHRFGCSIDREKEIEAAWFTAEFLMPEKAFIEAARKLGVDARRLGHRFEVPSIYASVRIWTLKLSNAPQ